MSRENFNLTKNITLFEYIEGTAMPKLAIKMAWYFFHATNEAKIRAFAPELQSIRDWVNQVFNSDTEPSKDITFVITAGFRPYEWEIKQGRSGKSQHTICAVDFNFGNCSIEQNAQILRAVFNKYDNEKWMGGLAIKFPTMEKTEIIKAGFVHLDPRTPDGKELNRGFGARWVY